MERTSSYRHAASDLFQPGVSFSTKAVLLHVTGADNLVLVIFGFSALSVPRSSALSARFSAQIFKQGSFSAPEI